MHACIPMLCLFVEVNLSRLSWIEKVLTRKYSECSENIYIYIL